MPPTSTAGAQTAEVTPPPAPSTTGKIVSGTIPATGGAGLIVFGGGTSDFSLIRVSRDGDRIDLRIFEIYDYTLCYWYRTIESDRDQTATISLGSDDWADVWLNGTKVHQYRGSRSVNIDEDVPF
mgnify:CR=1 FL=1